MCLTRLVLELMRRAFSIFEIVVAIGIVGLLGSVALPRIRPTMELIRYRSAMQVIAAELRIMRFRAMNEQRTFAMRIDRPSGMIQLVSMEMEPVPREEIERTIWLPEGLELLEAPERLMIFPSGAMAPASLLAQVPEAGRVFRLTVSSHGIVRLNEEPAT